MPSMRVVVSLLAVLLMAWPSSRSWAVPALGRPTAIVNADGTTFVGVTRGDEWNNWIETKDGFTVSRHVDGNWYYVAKYDGRTPVLDATPARAKAPAYLAKHVLPDASVRKSGPARGRAALGPQAGPFGPFTGPVLFLLAEFTNRSGTTTPASWASFITNEIADFYDAASHGAVALTPAAETSGTANDGVVGWLNLGYAHPATDDLIDDRNQQITRDALLAADPFVNFAAYDTDNNGYVAPDELAVVAIVAGFERSYAPLSPSVWGHQWAIYCCGGAPVLDGVIVGADGYAQFGERHDSGSDGHQATMGIMVHELGHLIFDLPDLYDTDYSSSGIGAFSVMSGGSWGAKSGDAYAGMTPVLPDAWVKYDRGWVTGTEGSGIESIVGSGAPAATAANTVFRTSSLVPTQYFLVENRQDVGYDRGLETMIPGFVGGVAIWHVDETQSSNTNDTHRKVDLEEADANESFGEGDDLWFVGNLTSFSDGSTPNSRLYSGASTGKSVEALTAPGATMDVLFSMPICGNGTAETGEACDAPDVGACPTGACDPDCTCPDPICGNDIVEEGESCDGTSDAACPGSCGPPSDPLECLCPTPDECASPRVIGALPYTDLQDTTSATIAPSDPTLGCGAGVPQPGHSVWYSLVAPGTGTLTVDTFGSNYDTVLAAFTGTCGGLSAVPGGCNDDNGGLQSAIAISVTSGTTYLLEVTDYGYGFGGNLVLHVSFVPTPTPTPTPTLLPGCAATPEVCRTPILSGKAQVALTDKSPDDKDQLQWKWANGADTPLASFGNPVLSGAYELCLYDGNGLLTTLVVPPAGMCAGKACWTAKPTGFTYKDKAGSAAGITQIALKAGPAGKAKIQVKGKGLNLPMPSLVGLASPLTVELRSATANSCWSARYTFPPVVKNDGVQFKDKAD